MDKRWIKLLASSIEELFEKGNAVEIEIRPYPKEKLKKEPNLEHFLGRTIVRLDPEENSRQMEDLIRTSLEKAGEQ